ncbi:hypothetical protein NQ318_000835 [Aromia moschata]|uniref:Superoxide dismutase [Cu-Zn] n=1 Tax=Aromia moschata TaxID=1265417 RepID=A0AAV8X886_9CUCU|nr:hypothetical protein NQ318_000835 [Aromia moschata]
MLTFAVLSTFLLYAFAEKSAVVNLSDPSGEYNVTGNIIFTQLDNGIVNITGTVTGLTPGNHGFHIHNLGNLEDGCTSTGAHFNPHNLTHGGPTDTIRHVGDLGNIVASNEGVSVINVTDNIIALEGLHNIIGRAVVVHALEDDLGRGGVPDSILTGNAGARASCGVIGILNDE